MLAPAAAAAVAEGRVDVAFLTLPPTPPRNLSYELVLADSIVAALPERHPLATRRTVPIKLLANEPQIVVARDRIAAYYQLIELICQQAGFLLNARHVVDHPQTTMALVAAEAGISLVPASYENVRRPGVIYRPIRPSVSVKMIAAWKTDDKSSVVRAFLDALRTVKA
jgi:DNA-binding transcriptional LysR family regulator